MPPQLEVQLRCEDGELLFARTVKEAMQMAEKDPDIWKISWTDSITDERIRLVRHGMVWVYEPIL
jgi:hypothetical protein